TRRSPMYCSRSRMALLAVALLAGFAALRTNPVSAGPDHLVTVTNGNANPVPVSTWPELVTLRWLGANQPFGHGNHPAQFVLQGADASFTSTVEYVVPAGKDLVITDVTWTAGVFNGNVEFRLYNTVPNSAPGTGREIF